LRFPLGLRTDTDATIASRFVDRSRSRPPLSRHATCFPNVTAATIAVLLFHRCFLNQETTMQWTTPAYTDLRFGFEITMYIANR
jgi:pyrroloquinoline quinone biosynthesis protein A